MSVARRAGSGAASACVQYATRRRWARWAAAARASRSCWAAEATRRCWAAAARANRNNAISSGPIITRVAKRSIAATTRTTAIPIAINISYNNIRSPPPLAEREMPKDMLDALIERLETEGDQYDHDFEPAEPDDARRGPG